MYTQLSEVLRLYAAEVAAGTIDATDYAVIKDQICKIVSIKEIPGTKCIDGEVKVIDDTTKPTETAGSTDTTDTSSS
jgi:hypothetical protein